MLRFKCLCLLSLFSLLVLTPLAISQTAARNQQALIVLQQSVAAMGGTVPADSQATGTITTTAGSLVETGSITIATRGSDQSLEKISTPSGGTVVYSGGLAVLSRDSSRSHFTAELGLTAQSALFPLPLLVGLVNNADSAYSYAGLETLNGASVHHVVLWNTLASTPRIARLASYSRRDIWIDASSGLVVRIAYNDHANQSSPPVPVQVDFSNYTNVSGVLYPFSISKSVNGTLWATITITGVVINAGLSSSDFSVE